MKKTQDVNLQDKALNPKGEANRITQLEKVADRLERMRVGEYLNNLNKTSRLIWLNFVSGIARGVGLTLGATLVIAIIFKIITALISLNVPYLSDAMQELQDTLQTRYQQPHHMKKPEAKP